MFYQSRVYSNCVVKQSDCTLSLERHFRRAIWKKKNHACTFGKNNGCAFVRPAPCTPLTQSTAHASPADNVHCSQTTHQRRPRPALVDSVRPSIPGVSTSGICPRATAPAARRRVASCRRQDPLIAAVLVRPRLQQCTPPVPWHHLASQRSSTSSGRAATLPRQWLRLRPAGGAARRA